jgi:hypothetical protein
MKRKPLLLLAVGVLALGLVVAGLWPVPANPSVPVTPGVNRENFLRLHAGMSEADAEAVLGKRAWLAVEGFSRDTGWFGEHCDIFLDFNDPYGDGAVSGELRTDDGQVLSLRPQPPAFWDQLRRLLPW